MALFIRRTVYQDTASSIFFFFNSLSKIIILKKSPLIKSKIRSNHLEKIHTQKDYISILGLGLRVTCSLAGFFMRGQTVTTN